VSDKVNIISHFETLAKMRLASDINFRIKERQT
jgi:hypothetical protein